jgi:hypothetical protein
MVHTVCLVCLISTVSGRSKKKENDLEDVALVAGTQQNLGNLYSLDIYGNIAQGNQGKHSTCTVIRIFTNFHFANLSTK